MQVESGTFKKFMPRMTLKIFRELFSIALHDFFGGLSFYRKDFDPYWEISTRQLLFQSSRLLLVSSVIFYREHSGLFFSPRDISDAGFQEGKMKTVLSEVNGT